MLFSLINESIILNRQKIKKIISSHHIKVNIKEI